ncbi:nitroreductase family deazaflavin-dependent oxidoreductase [Mycolicibacterium sp. P9-64]|uniref:nitroreductase family deazaflavin-dependent oxidoreductase n=1 Tax=Mycolicibacterium sp. P9-64 TaxID=2024612 RepID=UPI0011EC53CA|nr:nitroreductase family deazaflavin-dependent oxidoreductase [Mycolicibacterium sp. P9-64]KAA0084400.1 nitroreductase family deazaflavin-dependent oxidoreductase [Mycolicibacterium sp. P9-64]
MTEIDREKLLNDVTALHAFNDDIVTKFRANDGKVPEFGDNLLLLTTTGAKSGQKRLSPLAFLDLDGRTIIFGSYGGAPKDPAWVHNLRANPQARIEVGTEAYDVVARELPTAERDEVVPAIIAVAPVFAEYESKSSRIIPLFELTRA